MRFARRRTVGAAYITTHIDNTIHRVPLQPSHGPEPARSPTPVIPSPIRWCGLQSIVWGKGCRADAAGDHERWSPGLTVDMR